MEISKRARMEYDEVPLDLSTRRAAASAANEHNKREDAESESSSSSSSTSSSATDLMMRSGKLNDSDIFVVPKVPPQTISVPDRLLAAECALSQKLRYVNFNFPVEYVYNPIEYAFQVHAMYVTKYCRTTKKILFLGMNPGPWGMSQTGVPFGEVAVVRDWLKVSGHVGKPIREQADRPVTGFNCTRSEISGRRFWNLFRELCHEDPEKFFRHAFLHNYCPIALMDAGGRNITPAELKGPEQYTLYAACDETLTAVLKLLKVEIILGVGRFAEKRAQTVVKTTGLPIKVLCIPHPSPRSVGNENWNEKAKLKLREYNLMEYFAN